MYANDANDAAVNELLKCQNVKMSKCLHGGFFAVAVAAQRHQVVHIVGPAVF